MIKLYKKWWFWIIIIFMIAIIAALFFPKLYIFYKVKLKVPYDKYPYMYERVVESDVMTGDLLQIKQRFTTNNLSFGVPFEKSPEIKEYEPGNIYKFEEDKKITILNGQPVNPLIEFKKSQNKEEIENFLESMNMDKDTSNHDFESTILNFSPNDFKFTDNIHQLTVLMTGIYMKLVLAVGPGDNFDIISFDNGDNRGFQFSSKGIIKKAIIEIDELATIVIDNVSQQEIDTIISSIRKI